MRYFPNSEIAFIAGFLYFGMFWTSLSKDKIVFYFRGFVEFFSHSAETKAALAENKVFCKVKQMISWLGFHAPIHKPILS